MAKYLKIEFLYMFVIIVWQPLQLFILKVDAAGRTLILLTLILVINLIRKGNFKQVFFLMPIPIWFIWIVYAFANTMQKGFSLPNTNEFIFFWSLCYPIVTMALIANKLKDPNELSRVFRVLVFAFTLFLVIGILNLSFDDDYLGVKRLSGNINANDFGINAVTLIFIILLGLSHKIISKLLAVFISIFPVLCIFWSGSRTAFWGLNLLLLFYILGFTFKSKLKYTAFVIIAFVILLNLGKSILHITNVGERILIARELPEKTGTIWDNLGHRGLDYYNGWKSFKENPITGIGLHNWTKSKYNPSGYFVLHTEFMVQLTECGIIGTILFFVFFAWFGKRILLRLTSRYSDRRILSIYMAGFCLLLLIASTSWIYNKPYVFSILGFIHSYVSIQEEY